MVAFDRRTALAQIGSESKNLGFLKDQFVGVVDYIESEGINISQRGIGAPYRATPEDMLHLMAEFVSKGITMDYALHGSPDQRASVARYINSILQPDEFWDEQIKKKGAFDTNTIAGLVDNYMGNDPAYGKRFNAGHVIMMPSGTPAFSGTFHSLCNPGEKVVMSQAFYNAYMDALKAAGVEPIILDAEAKDNFQPAKDSQLKAFKEDKDVRIIIDVNQNPSGISRTNDQAMERALEWIEIKKVAKEQGREVTFMQDIVYHDMKKKTKKGKEGVEERTEDCTVARALQKIVNEGRENAGLAEEVLKDSLFIVSNSKIKRKAPTVGAVIAYAEEKLKGLKGYFISNLLSVNKFFAEDFARSMDSIVAEKAALVGQGKNPNYHGQVIDESQSYIREQKYYLAKQDEIAISMGAIKEGETLTPQTANSAIYAFSKLVEMFNKRDLPEDVSIKVKKGDSVELVSLREFVLDNPSKNSRITNGTEVCRLMYGLAAIDDETRKKLAQKGDVQKIAEQAFLSMSEGLIEPVGVRGRTGEAFRVDDSVRHNIAGLRVDHMQSLAVSYMCCRLLGMNPNKEVNLNQVGVEVGVQAKLFQLPAPGGSFVTVNNARDASRAAGV